MTFWFAGLYVCIRSEYIAFSSSGGTNVITTPWKEREEEKADRLSATVIKI